MKLDILAVGAHPDDVELGCSGVLAKEIARGKRIGILDLTQGELGTRGTAEIRKAEATHAAEILGVEIRENMEFRDGFIQNDEDHQLALIQRIRKYKPEIVLANAIDDRHTDHAKASKLTATACFLSGLRRIETQWEGENQEAWRPRHVLHYIQWKDLKPDIVIDISGFMEQKLKAVQAYQSQFFDVNSKEPATPISTSNFLDSVKYRASNFGRLVFADYAEGFTMEKYPAVDSVFDLL